MAVTSAIKIKLIIYDSGKISSFLSILSNKMESIMSETKDLSLFTEITAEESASVNGGHYCYRPPTRCRPRRPRPCRNYSYSPYFDGRRVSSYVHNSGYRDYYN
jgi:hypothetical protein